MDELENLKKELDFGLDEELNDLLGILDEIPYLPQGKNFVFEIKSTWGDRHYVGLSGIEFFDEKGQPIKILNAKKQVKAEPADINILPGYGNDPRTVDKLVDGVYKTCDDLHVWLAPFLGKEKTHKIMIDFEQSKIISMIRVWNFNKSRIHSYRGVKEAEIYLDSKCIFKGEI